MTTPLILPADTPAPFTRAELTALRDTPLADPTGRRVAATLLTLFEVAADQQRTIVRLQADIRQAAVDAVAPLMDLAARDQQGRIELDQRVRELESARDQRKREDDAIEGVCFDHVRRGEEVLNEVREVFALFRERGILTLEELCDCQTRSQATTDQHMAALADRMEALEAREDDGGEQEGTEGTDP